MKIEIAAIGECAALQYGVGLDSTTNRHFTDNLNSQARTAGLSTERGSATVKTKEQLTATGSLTARQPVELKKIVTFLNAARKVIV